MSSVRTVSFLWRPVLGARDIGWGDAGLAAALSVYAILLVGNVVTTVPHGGALAAVAVLAMTAPVAWERRAPVVAAAVVAIGAAANELLIGKMVRCGPARRVRDRVLRRHQADRPQAWFRGSMLRRRCEYPGAV